MKEYWMLDGALVTVVSVRLCIQKYLPFNQNASLKKKEFRVIEFFYIKLSVIPN